MLSRLTAGFAAALLFSVVPGTAAQPAYVSRYDAYFGYALLDSPNIGLVEHGFALQTGVRVNRWLSAGFDYSFSTGDLTLTPGLLTTALQQQLAAQLGQLAALGALPPGYSLAVPAHSRTQTFAVGPQVSYRRIHGIALFLRPVFAGLIHETATPRPTDPIAAAIATQLAPSGAKKDTAPFVGFGGGLDVILSKHFSVRTQVDLVHDHLFDDLLKDGRFTVRFSVGPAFNFGSNVK